ncbi:adhesion G protein-coupled receptor F4-like [Pseudorasbora parva]|uniref:adhesion G protein-coupled receptor F4-like n=1 Tax=Pseudorasbora parva TaxID=51549 RepID=UPI00351E590A
MTTSAPPILTTTSPPIPVTTSPTSVRKWSMTINKDFDSSLSDSTDDKFKRYVNKIKLEIDKSYKNVSSYVSGSLTVTRFRPGSIIADFEFQVKTNSLSDPNGNDFSSANLNVFKALENTEIPLVQNPFSESVQTNLSNAEKWYPFQTMKLRCTRPESVQGAMTWRVNDQDPTIDTSKYFISPDSTTLTVHNATERDNGKYSCIIERPSLPYVQWQTIFLEPRPNILMNMTKRKIQCNAETIRLSCCEDNYDVLWDEINGMNISKDGSCLILKYQIQSDNCGEKTFTCRTKNQPALQTFSYSWNSVTVNLVTGAFDCNDYHGVGNIDETVTGACEKGKEGTIIYKCSLSKKWEELQNDCVVKVIKDLQRKVEGLGVEQIPGFVAQLSNATLQYNQEITQSPLTVKIIVGILVNIASLSKKTAINKIVMENFLQTVDILVSNETNNSWGTINKISTSGDTSVNLLGAVENISKRLTNDTFAINSTSSLQLNRTIVNTSYSGISSLPNSSTEILIPQVFGPTALTVIVFTNLDKVLPTRNTSNNDSTNSVSIINGDVVIVNANQTLSNISFAFGITNQSLGNPQCVFWNFSLDAWDSTGCKVKLSVNTTVTCECNHTTSFSILMSPFSNPHKALAYITYIGVAISMASLILCLIIETIVWKSITRNDTSYMRHVSIVNIAVSLLIANICFIIGAAVAEQEQPTSVVRCSPAVFFMHFFYLALFFWMLISALLLFYRTVMVLSQMSRASMMAIAFIVGYGAPLLIAVITVASTAGPQNYITKQYACWLNWDESKALLAFVIPALTIVAINLVVLIVVLYKMLRRGVSAATQPDEKHALVVIARCVAILTPIFGLTWGFGIGTMVSRELGIHVVFALLNSLQGFFILVFGTLLDSKTREALAGRLSLRNFASSDRTRSTSEGPSSSSGPGFFQRMRRRRNMYNISSDMPAATSSNISSGSDTVMNA